MLLRFLRWLNHHRTTELYFVGYPKTGNTWVRYMLGRYVQLCCNLPDVPLFDATDWLGRCERFCTGPAIQFTHRPLLWTDQRASDLGYYNVIRPFEGKSVVLLIRHPLDTLVSLWMQRRFRGAGDYSGDLLSMIEDPVWGLDKFIRFYELWLRYSDRVARFRILRYEDMRADPGAEFSAVLDFIGIRKDEVALRQAIADADFANMRRMEQAGQGPRYPSSGLNIFGDGERSSDDAFHVRRGKVGGFREHLSPADVERLVQLIDQKLPQLFGYSSHTIARSMNVH